MGARTDHTPDLRAVQAQQGATVCVPSTATRRQSVAPCGTSAVGRDTGEQCIKVRRAGSCKRTTGERRVADKAENGVRHFYLQHKHNGIERTDTKAKDSQLGKGENHYAIKSHAQRHRRSM